MNIATAIEPEAEKLIPQMTERERGLLLKQWNNHAETLMNRDGTDARFKDGGHRIKQNPLLTAAIEEIRDEYYALFNEKRHLLRHPELPDMDIRLRDHDYDLILHNHDSFMRLQQPDYGFSPARKAEILATAEPGMMQDGFEPLSKTDAAKIVGTTIKRSILSFETAFERERTPRMHVPHVPLIATPERTNRFRSTPRQGDDPAGRSL
jgi:hypothetical protein